MSLLALGAARLARTAARALVAARRLVAPGRLRRGAAALAVAGLGAATLPLIVGADALKPQAGGLLDRHGLAREPYRHVVNDWVVKVPWADLQPQEGGPISGGNPIDRAVEAARHLNAADSSLGLRIKLRVQAGIHAPNWAKHLDGTPMVICENPDVASDGKAECGTVGRFWTRRFGAAYDDLQRRLAERYERVEEILETAITRCTTIFSEPMLRQANVPENVVEYSKAGYSLEEDLRCQLEEVDAHRVWRHTRSAIALNPYQAIDLLADPPRARPDLHVTKRVMTYCRDVLGPRCVLGNNSLKASSRGDAYDELYEAMTAMGGPLYFQTATLVKIGGADPLRATLNLAVRLGAGAVELPHGYDEVLSPAELREVDESLEAAAGAAPGTGGEEAAPAPPPPPADNVPPPPPEATSPQPEPDSEPSEESPPPGPRPATQEASSGTLLDFGSLSIGSGGLDPPSRPAPAPLPTAPSCVLQIGALCL